MILLDIIFTAIVIVLFAAFSFGSDIVFYLFQSVSNNIDIAIVVCIAFITLRCCIDVFINVRHKDSGHNNTALFICDFMRFVPIMLFYLEFINQAVHKTSQPNVLYTISKAISVILPMLPIFMWNFCVMKEIYSAEYVAPSWRIKSLFGWTVVCIISDAAVSYPIFFR